MASERFVDVLVERLLMASLAVPVRGRSRRRRLAAVGAAAVVVRVVRVG